MDDITIQKLYFEDIYNFADRDCCAKIKKKCTSVETPVFSFLMCVYNDVSLLNNAISSLINQSFDQWELIILDNSDKNEIAWQMICNAMEVDDRIIGIKGEKNVGWAKGASLCLEKARGKYMSFLAADDCICKGALQKLWKHISEEYPDILWVGNSYVSLTEDSVNVYAKTSPEYRMYEGDVRSQTIGELMKSVYYNSFFHYVNVEFCKKHNINFFEPYYADCVGMTYAMAKAEKMVVVDDIIYTLTTSTSQTRGYYIWDSYEFLYGLQWKIVKEVFEKENYVEKEHIYYIAWRIFRNLASAISNLCAGRCRNKYMNPVEESVEEIIGQLQNILLNSEVKEMLEILGQDGFEMLLNNLENTEDFLKKSSWLEKLFLIVQETAVEREKEFIEHLADFILEDENTTCIGWGRFCSGFEKASDEVVEKMSAKAKKVIKKIEIYLDNKEENVWEKQIFIS